MSVETHRPQSQQLFKEIPLTIVDLTTSELLPKGVDERRDAVSADEAYVWVDLPNVKPVLDPNGKWIHAEDGRKYHPLDLMNGSANPLTQYMVDSETWEELPFTIEQGSVVVSKRKLLKEVSRYPKPFLSKVAPPQFGKDTSE